MAPKRPSEGDLPQATKIPKLEPGVAVSPLTTPQQQRLPNSDFSGSVKKKLASSSRTGQACDRCKVRTPHGAATPIPLVFRVAFDV